MKLKIRAYGIIKKNAMFLKSMQETSTISSQKLPKV